VIKKIKQLITTASFALLFAAPLAVPVTVGAQQTENADIQNSVCTGAELTTDPTTCENANIEDAGTNIDKIIATVINIFSFVVGVVSVIMIIVGGFQYITSGGDSNKVTAAKNTILYAIIGLVIVALAQFIVRFVLKNVNV
jgi:hypothetical protein